MFLGDFKLEINTRFSELENIFDCNHQNMITDKSAIHKQDFDKLVCIYDNNAVGYLVIYKDSDWIQQEQYPIDFKPAKNCVYVWNMVTKKDFQNRGVAFFLLNKLKFLYPDMVIYATADV